MIPHIEFEPFTEGMSILLAYLSQSFTASSHVHKCRWADNAARVRVGVALVKTRFASCARGFFRCITNYTVNEFSPNSAYGRATAIR